GFEEDGRRAPGGGPLRDARGRPRTPPRAEHTPLLAPHGDAAAGRNADPADGLAQRWQALLPGECDRREGPSGRRVSRTERARHDALARADGRSRPRAGGLDGRSATPAVEAARRSGGSGAGGSAREKSGRPSSGKARVGRAERSARPAPPPLPRPTLAPGAPTQPAALVGDEPDELPQARPSKPTGPVIGIDLGTTNSCAAVVKDGKPFVIPSREGYNTIPSVVAL